MKSLLQILLIGLLAVAPATQAQHGDSGVPAFSAPAQARQFDFLIGLWEIELTPKVSSLVALIHGAPHLAGTWKAWPAMDGFGIEDELRVVDGSGNPQTLNHALRVYDSNKTQWVITGVDVYRALVSEARAHWQDGEMHVDGAGTNRDGTRYLSRTRFYAIGADGFSMQQDRSSDGGASWEEAAITIVAKRAAATAPR